jgi:hypothetical protein
MKPSEMTRMLGQLNKIRVAVGIGDGTLEAMPKGIPGKATECPIARALSNGWKAEVDMKCIVLYYHGDKEVDYEAIGLQLRRDRFRGVEVDAVAMTISFSTPALMAKFITEFDSSELPDLIEGN